MLPVRRSGGKYPCAVPAQNSARRVGIFHRRLDRSMMLFYHHFVSKPYQLSQFKFSYVLFINLQNTVLF
jgi:hypothetical protein